MKRILVTVVAITLTSPVFAAKWNPVTGDDLKSLLTGTVLTMNYKGSKFTLHNCADGTSSFMKVNKDEPYKRTYTFPTDSEVCIEDFRGNSCYNFFQNAKKPEKIKWKGTTVSKSGKYKLTDGSPDFCN